MKDLEKAKTLLEQGAYTCVLCLNDRVHTSTRRGVAPLLALLESGESLQGFCAADKVVGRATALLYRLLGVRAVYGAVMSRGGLEALRAGGIEASCGCLTDRIINRQGTGPCPMEAATEGISDPVQALSAILGKLRELKGK